MKIITPPKATRPTTTKCGDCDAVLGVEKDDCRYVQGTPVAFWETSCMVCGKTLYIDMLKVAWKL